MKKKSAHVIPLASARQSESSTVRPCARWPGSLRSWLAGHCPWVLVWAGSYYWHGVGGFVLKVEGLTLHRALRRMAGLVFVWFSGYWRALAKGTAWAFFF